MPTTPLRQHILDAARDLFVERGGSAVTMRGVAARVGVTPMALYRHFASREALLAELVTQGHDAFLGYLNRALAEPTAAGRLVASSRQYLAFALEHPQTYAVMFMEPADAPAAGDQRWRDLATFRFLVDRIRDAAAEGALVVDDPEEAALLVWAQVHGLVSLYLAGKLAMERAAFARVYVAAIGRLQASFGWTGPPATTPPRRMAPTSVRRTRKKVIR